MLYQETSLFDFDKKIILLLFANHPRPLSTTEAHFYYVLLKNSNPPKLEPMNLETEIQNFSKTLQVLIQANFLKIENINGYPCFSFNFQKSNSSLVNEKISFLLEKIDQFLFDKLSPEEYPALTALLIIKRRFPFLKAHELQIPLERLFGLKAPYKTVQYLYNITEHVLDTYNMLLKLHGQRKDISN